MPVANKRPSITRVADFSIGYNDDCSFPTIFEKSVEGRRGYDCDPVGADVDDSFLNKVLPSKNRREQKIGLPELSEVDVVRHFVNLSKLNFSIEQSAYPLGSCTMKYNPRLNEDLVKIDGFANLHPNTPPKACQGALQLVHELAESLIGITGMKNVTMQPAAGSHGELTGVMMMKKAALSKGHTHKKYVIIPDSAHGTNPATCAMVGLKIRNLKTGPDGIVRMEDIKPLIDDDVLGVMITNPNTLGLFEENIAEIAKLIHDVGGYVYMDGANLNALMGKALPGDLGVDAMHINLHKTFSQPHGGGGPGSGPVVVSERLEHFMPYPRVVKTTNDEGEDYFDLESNCPDAIGTMREFVGNFGVFVRSYGFILRLGINGLKGVTENAVLNANYIRATLEGTYEIAYKKRSLHEVVTSDKGFGDISTLDIAKRLLDYGFHPPTTYFPLIVKGALMIEPTESESKDSLDSLNSALLEIAKEAKETPEIFHDAPYTTPVGRIDEATAARKPVLVAE